MFTKSAEFYDKLYDWKDYAGETSHLHELIQLHKGTEGVALLDVACGTGAHLEYLRLHYQVEGLDLDGEMLAIARQRFPDMTFHHGDMRDFDLGKTYDVITCLFSSIAYTATPDNLQQAFHTFYKHLKPGGVALVEGFIEPDAWHDRHVGAIFVDEPDLKITRMNRSQRDGDLVHVTFHYLVGTPESIDYFTEDHQLALFSDAQYLTSLQAAGFDAKKAGSGLIAEKSLFIGVRPL